MFFRFFRYKKFFFLNLNTVVVLRIVHLWGKSGFDFLLGLIFDFDHILTIFGQNDDDVTKFSNFFIFGFSEKIFFLKCSVEEYEVRDIIFFSIRLLLKKL